MMIVKPYVPVNCNFHDRLLHFATTREVVEVCVDSDAGEVRFAGKIKDVFTQEGAEFVLFEAGEKFRLDELVEVGGFLADGGCVV